MLFNSLQFGVFFTVVFAVYWLLAGERWRQTRLWFLLLASYFFYAGWNVSYLSLIIGISLVNYFAGAEMERRAGPLGRKLWLTGALVVSLGILGVFKYYNFFTENLNDLLTATGAGWRAPASRLLLPVGISFYTFQCLSYAIDVYRRRIPPAESLRDYCLYIAFFPQLVAGPIVRTEDLLPQFSHDPVYDHDRAMRGLYQALCGLFKKVVLADGLAVTLVDRAFTDPHAAGLPLTWLAIFGYTIQIYLDFSGYSDVAIGSARMLGFDLRPNFDRPYRSADLREFWRRWHISFSTWLRDYVYKSLGGSRAGAARMYIALFLTMLIGGFWHGAAWTFILWGAYHGVLIAMSRWGDERKKRSRGRDFSPGTNHAATEVAATDMGTGLAWLWARRIFTIFLVAVGLTIFRSSSVPAAGVLLGRLFTGGLTAEGLTGAGLGLFAAAWFLHLSPPVWRDRLGEVFVKMPFFVQGAAIAFIIAMVSLMNEVSVPFIYFQF